MKKLIILPFSIFISINSYSGIFFEENICFETDWHNIVFLPNETNPYTGEYLCKYENGKKEKEGRYIDGKLIGKLTIWYESGQKKSEANYKNGKLDGKSTWWNKRGQKIMQKEYISGHLDGKLIEWFQFNGEIKREENYKNGKILF
jgi:antitoxin component YwqK of YwqJK toxin-antitoxin module